MTAKEIIECRMIYEDGYTPSDIEMDIVVKR